MWPYLIMLGLIFVPWLFIKKTKQNERRWLIYTWCILSLVEGLRAYSVGTDTSTYVQLFQTQNFRTMEVGYQWFTTVIGKITENPTIYLLIVAFIINGLVIRAISILSKQPDVSVFAYISLYFYFNAFNGLRQYIAIALVLTAYCYIKEQKLVKAAVCELIAFSFHNSAIIGLLLIPMYFITHRNESNTQTQTPKKYYFLNIILPLAFFFAFQYGFDAIYNMFLSYFPQYLIYAGRAAFSGTNAIQQKVVYTAIFLVYTLFCNDNEWTLMLSYSVCLALMMSRIQMMSRFLWYYDIFSVFAIAEIWNSERFTRSSLKIVRIAIATVLLLFLLYYLSVGMMRVTPYKFAL